MSEQQRVNLAIGICLVIMTIYFVIAPTPPPPVQNPETNVAATEINKADIPPKQENLEDGTELAGTPVEDVPKQSISAQTERLTYTLVNKSAGLSVLSLNQYQERPQEDAPEAKDPVSLILEAEEEKEAQDQAQVRFNLKGAAEPIWIAEQDGKKLTLKSQSNAVQSKITLNPRENSYALDYTLTVQNNGQTPISMAPSVRMILRMTGPKPSMFSPGGERVQALCSTSDDVERFDAETLKEDGAFKADSIQWAGIDKQYFVLGLWPTDTAVQNTLGCTLSNDGFAAISTVTFPEQSVAPGQSAQATFALYAGPKRGPDLEAVAPPLGDSLEYDIGPIPLGFLARPMVYLLNIFEGLTGSWGSAILLLTLLVKLIMFPVTLRSSLSMKKMQTLRPELDKLKERFPGDRERQQMEQLKLFKEKGVNPMGGCLPMLLQMPVWFALYRSLWTAVDLYNQPFLWLSDLTAKESIPFLALASGGLMIAQQRMTPMAMDNQQAKVMMWLMPVMFTVFMLSVPSGLVLYIAFNSVLTLIQTLVINRQKDAAA